MPDPLCPSLPGIHCSLFCLTFLSCTYIACSNGVAIVDEQTTQTVRKKTGRGEKDASSVSEQDSRSSHSQQTICNYLKQHSNLRETEGGRGLHLDRAGFNFGLGYLLAVQPWATHLISCTFSVLFCALETMIPASGGHRRMK